jgi:tRNA-dihydrouridine synthase B
LVRENQKTLEMTDFVEAERPIVQQIFGSDPLTMAKAAEIVMKHANPEGIDINMGCPVYKITSNFNGCALMKDPELAKKIITEMKQAIGKTPLSVKIRLGWSNPDDFQNFIPVLKEAGVNLITMHGRTKAQGYSGNSDFERLKIAAEICKNLDLPFLANGDIHKPFQVKEKLNFTGATGVLIARGSLGNPWFFKEVLNPDFEPTLEERISVILEHLDLHLARYGEKGITTFRKHLSWYFKGGRIETKIPNLKDLRVKMMNTKDKNEIISILKSMI